MKIEHKPTTSDVPPWAIVDRDGKVIARHTTKPIAEKALARMQDVGDPHCYGGSGRINPYGSSLDW